MRGMKQEETVNNLSIQRGVCSLRTMACRKSFLQTSQLFSDPEYTVYTVCEVTILCKLHKQKHKRLDVPLCTFFTQRGDQRPHRSFKGTLGEDPLNIH